jgi:hypothetical protein
MTPRGFARPIRPAGLEVFFEDRPLPLARWPDEGFVRVTDVPSVPDRQVASAEVAERVGRWAAEPDLWAFGYWYHDWADSYDKVSALDAAKATLTFAAPGSNYGYRKGQRFYVLNALSELDRPGEWYVDREKGILYRDHDYAHRYPTCWRCKTDLVFRLVDEWYIDVDGMREQMMEVARTIRWITEFGLARELDWLKNMGPWMISKKRYWGLALPIYECEACGTFDVIGSKDELRERAVSGWEEFAGHTPHRPWVDTVKVACADASCASADASPALDWSSEA